jgi:hypothetical protein
MAQYLQLIKQPEKSTCRLPKIAAFLAESLRNSWDFSLQ